jgi:hypothetical protein
MDLVYTKKDFRNYSRLCHAVRRMNAALKGKKNAEMLDSMQTATHYAGVIHTAAGGSGTSPPSL